MRKYKVYLAGPIAGCTYDESEDWRLAVKERMPEQIEVYSPLRGKEFLRQEGVLTALPYAEQAVSTARGIVGRDHNDVRTSDAVLMNLLGASRISIGSVIEAAWCFAYRVPLVLVMEQGNLHEHAMLCEIPTYQVPSIESGCTLIQQLLLS